MHFKFKKTVYFIILLHPCLFAQFNSLKILESNGKQYLANRVVVKLNQSSSGKIPDATSLYYSLRQKMEMYNISEISSYFRTNAKDEQDLSGILELTYNSDEDPEVVSGFLQGTAEVLWAEPHYVYRLSYMPDDPSYTEQWGLKKIMAEDAWDISHGDTSVIIGIADSGIDWDHPDLNKNIWSNYDEIPGNGIDDDNNGYADDIMGWDFGGNAGTADNDPSEDRPDHGSHVAGIAGAVTDNSAGISSIGFNCKLMPVKTCIDNFRDPDGHPYVVFGFEAIVYAADNGAQIINCSWGGTEYSKAGEEAVKYASAKGALIVAAAGNNSSEEPFYPASYKGVLSVASTSPDDKLSSFSNYGYNIDVSAPGESIYSTWMNDTYETLQGTSMAAPLVAGLAGLVKSKYPGYTNIQLAEQIRVNTDKIDLLNSPYESITGSGRINAYKSLGNSASLSVRAYELFVSDEIPYGNGNGVFEEGETISIGVKFLNILNPFNSMNILLESIDTNIVIVNSLFTPGPAAMLDSFNNNSNKFTARIKPGTPENSTVRFLLKYSSGDYADYQLDSIFVNQTFQTQSAGKVAMTITSSGSLGYNDFWENKQGIGFTYSGSQSLLYEGALMFGTSAEYISDAARGITFKDSAFRKIDPVIFFNSVNADTEGFTSFSDQGAGETRLDIKTLLYAYSWNLNPYDNFIIHRYRMINNHGSDLDNFYTGLYLDWNLTDNGVQSDVAAFNEENNLGYVFKIGGNPAMYTGCALLAPNNCNYYAISNGGSDGGISVYAGSGGFTKQEKWLALTNGTSKRLAENNDVSFVISSGPNEIKKLDTLEVVFAIAAADNLNLLKETVDHAREKYNLITGNISEVEEGTSQPLSFYLSQNYPNPFNSSTNFGFRIANFGFVSLKVYDVLGKEIATLVNEEKTPGEYSINFNASNLSSGVYYYTLRARSFKETRKMLVLK